MAMLIRILPFLPGTRTTRQVLGSTITDVLQNSSGNWGLPSRQRRVICFRGSVKSVQTSRKISVSGTSSTMEEKVPTSFLRDKKIAPDSDPPSMQDVKLLYQFIDQITKLVVLTGAGISTECGIPDYRSPNGAYSSGFKPITPQEFLWSSRAVRRYWARSYAGWRQFNAAQPSAAHLALASLEKGGRINLMITQDVDSGQWQLKVWILTTLVQTSFGMKQRPDGDIGIDEIFWEDFHIPTCQKCNGVLKPNVVFFSDNVPKDGADKAIQAAKECDAFLVLGSSVMTFSAFRLVRAAYEAGAATAIVNVGVTSADDFVPLKINARSGEILPRVLHMGSLSIALLS